MAKRSRAPLRAWLEISTLCTTEVRSMGKESGSRDERDHDGEDEAFDVGGLAE